ncbi:hypothetical protein KLEB273_gp093 [Bacillus phage vB_BauM_KLEB27-3]|nr:hypothetical protein KLEB273_gp093 [Bacillus phage vB_BauM_KLEB27-3]
MADTPNSNSDRDEGIRGELLRRKDDQKRYENLPPLQYEDFSNNPPADSFYSTGRGCPKCSGFLRMFELGEDKKTLWVYCKKCHARFSHQDLESDEIYRTIPKSMMLQWVEARYGKD